jgi:inosine-uridine nucleoside N-ribohydrolase
MRKVVIDTDICSGLGGDADDALALLLLLQHPDIEVAGITIVHGNMDLGLKGKMVAKILQATNNEEVPFYLGAEKSLLGHIRERKPLLISPDYFDDVRLEPASGYAAEFLAEILLEPDISVVTLGALTNFALALSLEPRLKDRLKDTVIMGGVMGQKKPEYNIACDPAAARVVFRSGLRFALVGLDVTRKVNLNQDEVQELVKIKSPAAQVATDISRQWLSLRKSDSFSLHDPLAAAVLLDKSIVRTKNFLLDVDNITPEGGILVGKQHRNGNPVALEVKDTLVVKEQITQGIWKLEPDS